MDAAELIRVKEVVAKSELLVREIETLKGVVKVGNETKALKFAFDPWGVWYADGQDIERLRSACSAEVLKDLSAEFRNAFVEIVERRLETRIKQLEDICV